MKIIRVPGDGNCLLHAIAAQLPKFTHAELRQILYYEYKYNTNAYKDFMERPVEYIENIKNDHVWLDETDISALSKILQCRIEVYKDRVDKAYSIYNENGKTIVRLLYIGEMHYDALII